MPVIPMPKGALAMLILRVLRSGPLHGYAIAQRIRQLSGDVLEAEEGSLYPALQRILIEGWVAARWGTSETGRRVRFYRLTADGAKQLKTGTEGIRAGNGSHPGDSQTGVRYLRCENSGGGFLFCCTGGASNASLRTKWKPTAK